MSGRRKPEDPARTQSPRGDAVERPQAAPTPGDLPVPAPVPLAARETLDPALEVPPFDAIVVAAGASRRMGATDKLSARIAGRSVLDWSVQALVDAGAERIVIVTASDRIASVAALAWLPPQVVAVVAGGERRQESVAAGLGALVQDNPDPERSVLIHDAARPLATPRLCRRVVAAVARHGAAIPVVPVAETLKRVEDGVILATVDRDGLAAAQTPQGFRLGLLERAFETFAPDGEWTWTDEAALLEACRIPVYAIEGEAGNLKVTLPGDLERAEALLLAHQPESRVPSGTAPVRVGFGTDTHAFGPHEPLMLGGLTFEGFPQLAGHSDGDVALHAVADALLGAAALGDLGRHFPADERTPRGADSARLLAEVVANVRKAGWQPASIDLTIVASRPRLAGRLPEMAIVIGRVLEVEPAAVSVKASTGNLDGSEGAGRTISAHAVAVLTREAQGPEPAVGGDA